MMLGYVMRDGIQHFHVSLTNNPSLVGKLLQKLIIYKQMQIN